MGIVESGVLVALALLAAEQLGAVILFAAYCLAWLRRPPASYTPRALVVLSLRGADPPLADCVRGVLRQDYPDYRVRIVLDHPRDPARRIVERILAAHPSQHVEVQTLRSPAATCSLKCSAVHQATDDYDDYEVVATLDSDIAPHRTWLRELVAPLADPKVGAAMGNRWYSAPQGKLGSLVCYLWNMSVVVSMYFYKVPWGGSLAVKTDVYRQSDLRERWLKAGCEDIPLFPVLWQLKQRLVFVPTLLMVSREDCSLAACLRFINRQFTWTRLYHPLAFYSGAVLYSALTTALVLAFGLAALAGVRGDSQSVAKMAIGLGVFYSIQIGLLVTLELLVRRLLAARGAKGCRLRPRMLAAIPLGQLLTPWMFLRAIVSRRIVWRGIEYRIRSAFRIRMTEYRPYEAAECPNAEPAPQPQVVFPNWQSRLFMKGPFERQFIIPPPSPPGVERFLEWYERRHLRPDTANIRIDRPIFLIGLHRSGTTMLQDLLCLHGDLAYINNAMPSFRRSFCAMEYFRKRLKLNFRGERMLGDSVDISADSPNEGVAFWREWIGEDHHNLSYIPRRLDDYSPQQIEQIYETIKRIVWCYEGRASRFFCKNPSLIPYLDLLKDLFPDAKFVHIVRDARTCANSMVKLYRLEQAQLDRIRAAGRHGIYDDRPYVAFPRLPRLDEYVRTFGADNIQTTARLWNDALDWVDRVRDQLPAFYEVRFEDILDSPVEQIDNILEFCELTPIPKSNSVFWQKLATVGQVHHSNRYSNYELIEEICGEKLAQYGYLAAHAPRQPSRIDEQQASHG